MAPRSFAASAALVLLLAAASPAAATDCLGALLSANLACTSEIASLRDGKGVPSSVSSSCCAAAADVFSASFGADCACGSAVAPYRALLDTAASELGAKCAKISALPSCGAATSSNKAVASAAVAAANPAWGTGSVCVKQSTTTGCATKCTRARANNAAPTDAAIAQAQTCASTQRGYCDGLTGNPSGASVCGKGFEVPDTQNRNRRCFRCCTISLAPVGNQAAKNACRNPASGGGGGGGGGGCFPGSSTVTLESGVSLPLNKLSVGDRVLTADPRSGLVSFQDVYHFGHSLPAPASSEFVRLEVEGGLKALELTRKHLVPTLPGPVYKRAMDVVAGDALLVVDEEAKTTRQAVVTSALPVVRSEGIFAPLTTGGGHVVVDGVLASVHSNNMLDALAVYLDRHDLLQWAYETFGASVLKTAYRVFGAEGMAKASPIITGLGLGDAAQLAVGARGLVQTVAAKTA